MSVYSPENYKSVAELQEIASIEHNINIPSTGKNIVSLNQDAIIGAYLMTTEERKLENSQKQNSNEESFI